MNCCSANPVVQELETLNQLKTGLKWLKGEFQEFTAVGGYGGRQCEQTPRVQANSWTVSKMDCRNCPGSFALPKQRL